jgi:hypothetical protein
MMASDRIMPGAIEMIHETSAGLTKIIINTGVSNRGFR